MLSDRGYRADASDGGTLVGCRSETDRIFVFFAERSKVGVMDVKAFAEKMRDSKVGRAVLVSQTPLTASARQCIAELAPRYTIEPVRYPELLSPQW